MFQLPMKLKEQDIILPLLTDMYTEKLEDVMKANGLDKTTALYRYTEEEHLSVDADGQYWITANPSSPEVVINHYHNGYMTPASEIGPGLAFTQKKDNRFEDEERVCVKVLLADVLNQNGLIYQDKSSGEIDSWFCTLPDSKIKVQIV